LAAGLIVIEEVGGKLTDWDGVPGIHGHRMLATNGTLHDELLQQVSMSAA
jgi:histidinol-phosphatase